MTDDPDVRRTFERDMSGIYDAAKAAGYNATRFLVMIREHGGLETARRLLASSDVSYGFTELWMLGRQDLTVEALVLKPDYEPLFTAEELRRAGDRLGIAVRTTNGENERPPTWTLDRFLSAASERGPVVGAVVSRFAARLRGHPSATRLGDGPTGPLYFAPRATDGQQVPVVCIGLDGSVQILFNDLVTRRPFDRSGARVELQRRLHAIVGFDVRDEVVETATWQTIDGAFLLSPGAFEGFTQVYDWVAERLVSNGA
jgi:hypothetical protein